MTAAVRRAPGISRHRAANSTVPVCIVVLATIFALAIGLGLGLGLGARDVAPADAGAE